jgi:hypothetical protein
MLILTLAEGIQSWYFNFMLAYLQADLNVDINLELPHGFCLNRYDKKDFVLKLHKNLHGLKQAGYNWFEKLKGRLEKDGFKPWVTQTPAYTPNRT